MAARRMFVNDLKKTLDTIYNDFMNKVNELDIFDTNAFPIENLEMFTKELLLSTHIVRDGNVMLVDKMYINWYTPCFKSVKWEIKTDKVVYDLKTKKFNDFFFPERKHDNYYFKWQYFVNKMLESCIYFDAEEYGCLDLTKYEKDVQNRFDHLCMCSFVARHAKSNIIDPLKGPNIAHLI